MESILIGSTVALEDPRVAHAAPCTSALLVHRLSAVAPRLIVVIRARSMQGRRRRAANAPRARCEHAVTWS